MKLPFFLANRFVAAETLVDTFPKVKGLNDKGLFVTLDLLGEYVTDPDVAQAAADAYLDLVRELAARRAADDAHATISIKLSMMGQKIDLDFCRANLRRLLTLAQEKDIFVRLDMEGSDVTQSTLDLFEEVYPDFPDHVGPVLQAYLHRTAADIDRMCALNARVRLCKGAYSEPTSIAYQDMPTIRTHFIAGMKKLIQHARYPGIATHDDLLINETKAFVQAENISPEDFEFQMLYGIRPDTQEALVKEGYNMRVYVPYGTQWLPYFSRRLRERKENIWFVLRNLFRR